MPNTYIVLEEYFSTLNISGLSVNTVNLKVQYVKFLGSPHF
jgi:hypothetical protein